MHMRTSHIWGVILLSAVLAYAQQKQLIHRTDVDDALQELETGELTLRFFNALTGVPVAGAQIEVEAVGTFDTDGEGKITFASPAEDISLKVLFQKDGFITSSFTIEILAGTLFFNRFSVSPTLPIGALRVVLDWDAQPRDLDAHLVKRGDYHISYRNLKVSSDGVAQLDRDDTDGNGPETITANRIDNNAGYLFFVHDYTNKSTPASPHLSNSKACIKVYGDNKLLKIFKVPDQKTGTYWPVFRLIKGQIVVPEPVITDKMPE